VMLWVPVMISVLAVCMDYTQWAALSNMSSCCCKLTTNLVPGWPHLPGQVVVHHQLKALHAWPLQQWRSTWPPMDLECPE